MGILDYIAKVSLDTMRPEYFSNSFQQRPNDDIALAHEEDLKMVKGVVRTNAIFCLRSGARPSDRTY